MRIEFRLSNIKPCSINKAYVRGRILSKEARTYRKRFLITLSKDASLQEALASIRDTFDPNKHALSLMTTYYIPQEDILTKKGHLSRRGGDVDNFAKLTTDNLCDKKYMDHKFPNCDHPRICNLGIDDQFIIDYDSSKRISPDGKYHIDIAITLTSITCVSQSADIDIISEYEPSDSV